MPCKVYVEVHARYDPDGVFTPESVVWTDGRQFEIQKVLDVRQAASQKAGGTGIRYTCLINGKEKFLFLEEIKDKQRWFMEGK